jgi:tetratricopeptide (TPR) repeat protein
MNANAQNNKDISQDSLYMRMFKNGMKYEDYRLAINSLQALYALHPNDIGYLDSLCLIYSQTQNYAQCILTGDEVLKSRPDDIAIINAVAASNQQIGRYQQSLELYKEEYSKNSSLYADYQIAVLQYALKKYGESQATLDGLMLNPKASTEKISFSTSNNASQLVLYKAAAENLMGIIYEDMKDNKRAAESFKAALAIQSDFVLAQNNLDSLNKKVDTK